MPILRLGTADLHHRVEGAGFPIVFLHGAGGSSLSWFQQIPHFSDGFTCAALDQPGFGASRWRADAQEFTDTLEEYVGRMGWESVALVAHSLGGWTALRFTLRHPARTAALVLSSTWAGVQAPEILRELEARESRLQAARAAWQRREPGSFLPGCGERMLREQPELHWLASSIASLNGEAGQAVWRRDADGDFDPVLNPKTDPVELSGWSVPTLCLTGDEDFMVPSTAVEVVARLLGGAEVIKIPQTGHSVHLERPRVFNSVVRPFLARHVSIASSARSSA